MSEWIKSEDELPPCDGKYLVTNSLEKFDDVMCLQYDGIGFKFEHSYRDPMYWREIPVMKKKYGKQK